VDRNFSARERHAQGSYADDAVQDRRAGRLCSIADASMANEEEALWPTHLCHMLSHR
jgi:hypothetical protein